jgi:hypothetical protein
MNARLPTLNDQPVYRCQLGREELVAKVARQIANGNPPLVFGVHGDWGAGKTSFLCQIEFALTGECTLHPDAAKERRPAASRDIKDVFTVWFEAWRYQSETSPVIALLHEIRRQLQQKSKTRDRFAKMKSGAAIMLKGIAGAFDALEAEVAADALFAKSKLKAKFRNPMESIRAEHSLHEEETLSQRLPTEKLHDLLRDALQALLGGDGKNRICIIVDDLDRCDPVAALKLLEGIKIYFPLRECVFVLGVNSRQIERAIGPYLPGASKEDAIGQRAEAAEYLEKLCTFTWKLPFLSLRGRAASLKRWLETNTSTASVPTNRLPLCLLDGLVELSNEFDCLPSNPRKIKSLANTILFLAGLRWDAPPGQELPINPATCLPEAACLLIAASIYYFFPNLLRFLQSHELAWNDFTSHLLTGTRLTKESDFSAEIEYLRVVDLAKVAEADKLPTPPRDTLSDIWKRAAVPRDLPVTATYYDPVDLRVFRVQKLLLAGLQGKQTTSSQRNVGPIDAAAMRPYLMLPL